MKLSLYLAKSFIQGPSSILCNIDLFTMSRSGVIAVLSQIICNFQSDKNML